MTENRSAPPGTMVPCLIYRDVSKAIDWLRGAFGLTERLRTPPEPDGTIHHAQLSIGDGSVILSGQRVAQPDEFIQTIMVRVVNIDDHFARAKAFGARILSPPDSKPFGERQYRAEDLEGRQWAFTESVADVPPEAWGAQVAEIQHRLTLLPRPRICYLQIPARDAHQSATFYERVFGWNIRQGESSHPRFDDASGNVSGGWFTELTPAREAGLLISIWVDDMDATLALVTAHGGEVAAAPHHDAPDSTAWIAHFRDPAGNLLGLYQETPRNEDRALFD